MPMSFDFPFTRVGDHDLPLPQRATDGAAGFDLRARAPRTIEPGQRVLVKTGWACALPEGTAGYIWPRSGLAVKHGLDTLAGLIDCDYRGELGVVLVNHGQETVEIQTGDRVAQLVVGPAYAPIPLEVAELPESQRGSGGFGSTGTR